MNTSTAIANFLRVQEIFYYVNILGLTAHLWPNRAYVEDGAEYDFIIVGGGTAGCVIASTLAAYKASVLLIEAGGHPPLESVYPTFFPFMKKSPNDWNVTSVEDVKFQSHKHSVAEITQGKMLGGSSSLNYMVYGRGNTEDYDHWATVTNDSSWSYHSVLPLFIRSEGVIDPLILNSTSDRALYGLDGKLKLTKYYDVIIMKYMTAFKEMGHEIIVDSNSRHLFGFTTALFSHGKFERSSSATFLRSVKGKPNLHVLTNALVTEIVFKGNTATGVKIKIKHKNIFTVTANKEVIVTAGVFKSAQLLMASGIGPKQELRKKRIYVVKDLPVGSNLQDHPICVTVYRMGEARKVKSLDPNKVNIPTIEGYVALEKTHKHPDYGIVSYIIDDPQVFLHFCSVLFSFKDKICDNIIKRVNGKQIYLVLNHLLYPKSRGEVHLRSMNMETQPKINLGYYSNHSDLVKHMKAVLDFHKVVNTKYFESVKAKFVDPKLEMCPDCKEDSDHYWRCYVANMVTTGHHYAGTCAMGSVVESNLTVKGIKNLRVADASIMPKLIGSPIQGAVYMIAQKAVDMIIETHKLEKK